MVSNGRFIFFTHSRNLLCTRSFLINFYQNNSKNALKTIKENIFPLQPKRPEGAFLLYVKHVRSKFVEKNPGLKFSEIIKKVSKEWAELNPVEKENFIQQYNKKYEVYMEELKVYKNSITNEQKELWKEKQQEYKERNKEVKVKQKSEVFGKPKQPRNAFLLYVISKKDERNSDISFLDWMKSVTACWKKLSETEKEPYITQAAQLRTQYKKDLDEWEMKMIHLGHCDIVRYKTLKHYKNVNNQQQE